MRRCAICNRGFRFGAEVYVMVGARIDDLDSEWGVSEVGCEDEDVVIHRACLGARPVEVVVEQVRPEQTPEVIERSDCLDALGL